MSEAEARALFLLAGFDVKTVFELANQYWPDNEHYAEVRRKSPWWLMSTKYGVIRIGWRKRVISINWEDTGISAEVAANEDVTKDQHLVHAWSHHKALEYLVNLRRAFAVAADLAATQEEKP